MSDSKKRKRVGGPLLVIAQAKQLLLDGVRLGVLDSFHNTHTNAQVVITLRLLETALSACEWCRANVKAPQQDLLGWDQQSLRGVSKEDKKTKIVKINAGKSAWPDYARKGGKKYCVEVCVGEEVVGFVMCQGATTADESFLPSGHGKKKRGSKLAHRNLADLEWLKTESDPAGQWKGVMQHALSYIVEQIKLIEEFEGIIAVIRETNGNSKRLAEAAGLQRKGKTFHVSYKGDSQSYVWLR